MYTKNILPFSMNWENCRKTELIFLIGLAEEGKI
jgi:hypothetical protein